MVFEVPEEFPEFPATTAASDFFTGGAAGTLGAAGGGGADVVVGVEVGVGVLLLLRLFSESSDAEASEAYEEAVEDGPELVVLPVLLLAGVATAGVEGVTAPAEEFREDAPPPVTSL